MTTFALTPLLRRQPPLPGESLPSLLARLAVCNFYEPPDLIHPLYLNGLPETKIERARHPATFLRLAILTGLEALTLYRTTVHAFAPVLNPPDQAEAYVELPGGEVGLLLDARLGPKQVRKATTVLFCPLCLKEAAYHRLLWLPFAVSACLAHRCLLLDHCPGCHQPVSIWDVAYSRCPQCQADLSQAPVLSLTHDEWGLCAQRLIQALLTGEASEVARDYALPEAPPGVLYRVLDGLRISTMQVPAAWSHFHRLELTDQTYALQPGRRSRATPLESYLRYATVSKALVNWPRGFYEFLRAYTTRPGRSSPSSFNQAFNTIQRVWLRRHWQQPQFQFVQDAFDQYLIDTYPLSTGLYKIFRRRHKLELADRCELISCSEAGRLVGVSQELIVKQVELGHLSVCEVPNHYSPARFVRRGEVLAWGQCLKEALSLSQAAVYLGLHPNQTVKLAKMGRLEVIRGPIVDGTRWWKFSRPSLIDYRQQIIRQVKLPPSPEVALIDLARAIDLLIYVGLDSFQLFERVATGQLPAYHPQPERARLDDLRFVETDIRACVKAVKAEKGWVTRQEIAKRMGLARQESLGEWIARGLLSPVVVHTEVQYFDREIVEAFIQDHLLIHQAAELLGKPQERIYDLIAEGDLKPVSGPNIDGCFRHLLRRSEIERLRKVMSLSQMAQHLGLNCAQVLQQVRRGELQPLSGPGIDDSPHYYFARPPELPGESTRNSQ